MYYYSPSTRGFYVSEIHGDNIPSDAIAISEELYTTLRDGESIGKLIKIGADGIPYLADPPPPSVAAVYAAKLADTRANGESVARSVRVPYSAEEAQTWWCQCHEAEEWTKNPSYVPVMLAAMVFASNGGWTLADLSASILTNADQWKMAAGNILGQVKSKVVALEALRDQVIAGAATISDLQAFDTSIALPTVNLEDKF